MTYLDYAATAPLVEPARTAWLEASGVIGNASSVHTDGRAARALLDDAREEIASLLGREAAEIVFTSGGTEADNLALSSGGVIVTTGIEHPAISEAAKLRGTVRVAPTTADGVVDVDELVRLSEGADLVSVMAANNETGIIQPLAEIADRVSGAALHTDAVQATGWIEIPDSYAFSVSGHKLGGPVGIGLLVASRTYPLAMIEGGGGQERKVRSGTLNVAGACALAAALAHRLEIRDELAARLSSWRDELVAAAQSLGGRQSGGDVDRLPHIAHLVFDGANPEAMIVGLDMAGIAASSGSACSAGVFRPSHVLEAMGDPGAGSALRFSLGEGTTRDDIDRVLSALPSVVGMGR